MSFESTDVSFHFCDGGGPGEDRLGNLGGSIHSLGIIEHGVRYNWVPDIPRSVLGLEGSSGTWNWYVPAHVRNRHGSITITNVKLWIYKIANNPGVHIQVAKDISGQNGSTGIISDHTDDPNGATFVGTTNEGNSILLASSLPPNNTVPIWVRIFGNKGIRSMKDCMFGIKVKFTRPA